MNMAQSQCVNPRRAEINWTLKTDFPVGSKVKYESDGEEISGYIVGTTENAKKFVLRSPVFRKGEFDSYDTALFGRLIIVDANKIVENGEFDWDMASKIMNACHIGRERKSLLEQAGGKSQTALQKPKVRKIRKGAAVLQAPVVDVKPTVSSEEYSKYIVVVDDLLTGIPAEKLKEILQEKSTFDAMKDIQSERGNASEQSKRIFTTVTDDLLSLVSEERKREFAKSPDLNMYRRIVQNYTEAE